LVASTVAAQLKCKRPQLQTSPTYQRAVFLSFILSSNIGKEADEEEGNEKETARAPLLSHATEKRATFSIETLLDE